MTLPASGQKWLDTLGTMRAAIAELAAERDRYRDALVARHGGEPLALLSELDAARAERDAAISQASSLTGRLDGALEVQRKLRAERDAVRQELNELDIYLRCRGAQGESVLARIQRMEHDRKNVDRFWQNAQTRGDVLQQQLDQCVQEREALAKNYRETIDDRDALLRIINDTFLSLHIPGSAKAFDGRNLVVHAQDSAEVAMVLRAERDEARRERDAALANTSLPGYVRLVEERDAARRDLESLTAAAKSLTEDPNACWEDFLAAVDAISRAQPEQPQQPPTQQPMVAEPPIQSGECSFLDQLPKGPALGRFSASERAELDELKRKAFKAGEP